ncbi:hypothetical protein BS47DRAFT_1360030 [Hydnum rufescens UP504]|uniref:Uncharacterized protein n=1 Tax=Hydnum rufescens UP504 TaxID=1448309 RepID=A0A9P6B3B7_9AGAM|nr:hypothetical protein BS47DRAFT_1360030 [Hydnum rufescens UP504]
MSQEQSLDFLWGYRHLAPTLSVEEETSNLSASPWLLPPKITSGPSKDHSDADTASVDTVTSQPHNGEHLSPVATQRAAKRKVMDAPPKVGPPGAKRKVHIVGSTPSTSQSTQPITDSHSSPAKTVHHAESPTPSSHSSPEKTAHCAEPPLPASNINLSSDDGPLSPSYLSDTPSQLLEEVQKYTPAELLKEAQVLALQLLKSIPEACPGDLLHIWDANSARHPHPLPSKAAHHQAKTVHFSNDDGSGNDGDSSELDDENTDEDVHQDNTTTSPGAKTQGKSYVTGPLPIELANEVKGLMQAFTNALAKLAEKHNHPLHQVEHLANLTLTLKAKHGSNPFNGYAWKWKKEGLPALPSSELKDAYLKEKEPFDGDPKGLESWLEDLCILAQTARVDNDIKLTQGSKAEMVHMAKFDVHTILFVVAGQAGAHAAHAQNAVICGSPEIEKIANGKFNLDKCLNDLFFKVLHQCLNRCGLLKWHEETKKAEKAKELKSHDAAYSATSKYIRNLFVDHAWFPNTVPWTHLLFMLAQHHSALPPTLDEATKHGKVESGDISLVNSTKAKTVPSRSSLGIRKMKMKMMILPQSLTGLVLHQCLNGCGLLKWHEETEKAEKAKELKSRDAAYSAASKYIRNLFVDHAWFPNTVPWTRLLFMLAQHHVRIVGGEWRYLVSEFHKGKDCSIKVKSWNLEDEDEDDDIALIIDWTGTVVCHVCDIAIEHSSLNTAGPSNVRHLSKDSHGRFTQSAKSEGLSSTNPPNSKRRKGKKAQLKSTEVITSGDEMDNDSLGLDAPNKPTELMITHPILHQHLDGPQNYGELGLNALQGASANFWPHIWKV